VDKIIKRYEGGLDGDLVICPGHGVAYQADMGRKVPYDAEYFNKCRSYEDQEIAVKINAGRIRIVDHYVDPGTPVLDVGVGSGEFVRKRPNTWGFDVNPVAEAWLRERKLWRPHLKGFTAYTFWDVIEHIEDPFESFKQIAEGSYLFTCLPIMSDLNRIRESRHYRPGEHLYYWTEAGFIEWMGHYGFDHVTTEKFEIEAGRDSIFTFVFKRVRGYNYLLSQYDKIHSTRHYGASATLYLDLVAGQVFKKHFESILDYGCGRSELAVYFWNDGRRKIVRYDPAIPEFKDMPDGRFDLVLCCDVMEHIGMMDVDRVFDEIKAKSSNVIFVISLKLARAKLPDQRNAHVTILSKLEWTRWIEEVFGVAKEMPTKWDHVLMVKTF